MRNVIASLLVAGLFVVLAGLAFIYSGLYDVSATGQHWGVTRWALETARTRSIEAHATGIETPPGLGDPAKILMGVEHFAAHCAVCHGAPGVPKGDIAAGLDPQPPDLSHASNRYTPSELFWILNVTVAFTCAGEFERAAQVTEQALEEARRRGDLLSVALILITRGFLAAQGSPVGLPGTFALIPGLHNTLDGKQSA